MHYLQSYDEVPPMSKKISYLKKEIIKINENCKNSKKGFTLVELIVVLVILAILAAVAVPVMLGYTDNARNKEYIANAESAYNATQGALTDLYNNASNELDHDKRMSVAKLAGVDADNTKFKVWTSKKLVDGETPSTSDNIGSYTLVYALYETSSDGKGIKVFYNGKNWEAFDDDGDLDDAMTAAGADKNSKNIINMWPDYAMGGPSDYAYNPKPLQEENWDIVDVNDKVYTLKIHNYNSIQGKNEAAIKFCKDEIETNEDTLTVEFEKDEAGGIRAINWISEYEIKNADETYLINYVDGFKELKWSTVKNPNDATDEDIYTYSQIKDNIIALTGKGVTDVYAVTEKEFISRTINFKCIDGSNAFTFQNGSTVVPITFKKYVNRYDCDDYNKNKALNKGDGTISDVKKIIINKGYEVNKWAFSDVSGYEYSGNDIKPYDTNKEEAEIWTKVFSVEAGIDSEEGINLSASGLSFVGMSKRVKKVTLYADSKNCSSFKQAKSLLFREEYDELKEELSDNFKEYNDKPLEPISGYRHVGWEEYNVFPPQTYETIDDIWKEVHDGNKSEYAYIAKVTYGSKAKFLCVSKDGDSSSSTFYAQIYSLFGNNRQKSDVNLFLHKKSYTEAVSFIRSASNDDDIISMLMTGFDDSDPTNDAAVPCSNHCKVSSVNRTVGEGTIKTIAILWDGNDPMYSIPIFAYNIVSADSKTYHVYWFSREERPELVGNFCGLFRNYYKINLSDSHMEDWNTSSCTNMCNMFENSGLGDNQMDFTKWDYSSVTDMSGMFKNCDNIKNFSFANCEMPKCRYFNDLFRNCDNLSTVNFDRIKTPSLEKVEYFFSTDNGNKESLVSFSAKGWYAPSLISVKGILKNRKSLEYASFCDYDENNKTDFSSCTNFNEVFYGCSKLKEVTLEGVNLESCEMIERMCQSCTSLTKINLDNCKMPKVTKTTEMLKDSNNITIFSAKGWDIRKVTSFNSFLSGKSKLTTVDFGKYVKNGEEISTNMSGCTTVEKMLNNCALLKTVSFEGVDLSACTNVGSMMASCPVLETVTFNYCDMSNYSGTFGANFFQNDNNLKYFYAKGWNIRKSTGIPALFNRGAYDNKILPDNSKGAYGKSLIEVVDFSGADMSSLNSLKETFRDCPSLKKVSFEGTKVGPTDSPILVDAFYCFFHCFYLEEVNFDFAEGTTLYPKDMYKFFDFCQSLNNVTFGDGDNWREYIDDKFNTKYATDMRNVFYQCYSLKNIIPFYEEFDFDNATSLMRMFLGANLEGMSIEFREKKFPKVTSTQEMFMATSVNKVSFISCSFDSLTDATNMFNYSTYENQYSDKNNPFLAANPIQEIDFTGSKMNKITNINKLFYNCINLETIVLDKCEMIKVNAINQGTFNYDNKLKYFYARGWNVPSVTTLHNMFYQRTGMQVFDISNYEGPNTGEITYTNISGCTNMSSMFNGCTSLNAVIFPDNIDMRKVTTYNNMFTDCSVFTRTAFSDMLSEWNLENSTVSFGTPSGDGAANIFVGKNTVDFFETLECYSADGQHFSIGGDITDKKFKALRKID